MQNIQVRTFDLHKALKAATIAAPVNVIEYSKDLHNVFLVVDEKQRNILTNARIKWEFI